MDGNGWTRLFIDISKDDNGLISGSQNMVDAHLAAQIADTSTVTDAKTTTFEQNLQEAGYFDDPEKLKGLLIAKPAESRPATASAVVYGFGTMAKYKQNFSGVLGKVKDKTAQMLKAAEAMAKQAAAKKGTLSLSEIKGKAKAAFASMDLSPNDDTVDYESYKKGCQFLGIFLTEAQALKIFRSADVEATGQLDFVNFQIGEKRAERRGRRVFCGAECGECSRPRQSSPLQCECGALQGGRESPCDQTARCSRRTGG